MFKYESDSRKVTKGQTFVALKGMTVDGHDFIDSAIKNGASHIICEKDIDVSVPYTKVENTDTYLIEILNTSDSSILKLYKDFYQSLGINFIYDTKTIEAIAKKASINSLGASELKVILEDALEIANFYINSSQKYKELIITSDTINNPNKYILRK